VDGAVLRPFTLSADRYARGQHRGVDLGAAPGAVVRSACPGLVTFVGRVPGGGLTVSVRCGGLVATYQGLARIAVRAARRVDRGAPLGAAGRSGDPRDRRPHVHLGVREARSGRYLDPLTFLRGGPPAAPLPPAAVPAWRRTDPPLVAPRPVTGPAPRPAPAPWTPRSPAAGPGRAPARVPLAPAAGPRRVPARVPWTAAARPRGAPAQRPAAPAAGRRREPTPHALPAGRAPESLAARPDAAPGAALPPTAWVGGSPPRVAPTGGRHGTDLPPGAPLDPAQDVDSPRYVALEIPWYVWAGLASVGLALPIGGFVALRGQRRRAAHRAAATVRGT
jgi:hypothetical protein